MILSESNLFKLIPMYVSLENCCSDFKLFILCMNDSVYHILNKIGFKNIVLVQLKDVEENNYDLEWLSLIEYFMNIVDTKTYIFILCN